MSTEPKWTILGRQAASGPANWHETRRLKVELICGPDTGGPLARLAVPDDHFDITSICLATRTAYVLTTGLGGSQSHRSRASCPRATNASGRFQRRGFSIRRRRHHQAATRAGGQRCLPSCREPARYDLRLPHHLHSVGWRHLVLERIPSVPMMMRHLRRLPYTTRATRGDNNILTRLRSRPRSGRPGSWSDWFDRPPKRLE